MSFMNDLPPESRPLPPPDPDPTPTQGIPTQQPSQQPVAAPDQPRLRDRLWSFRALIAVALASVIVGGLGGAALANVSDNGNDGRRGPSQFNRGGGLGGPGMMNGGPQNGPQNRPQNGRRPDRRGTGQGQSGQDGGPNGQPPAVPSPVVPTPTS